MPPKGPITVKAQTLDFESKVDEITKLVRQFVELKSGFGEEHVKSRTMQNILKQFDIDHVGSLDAKEFAKALDYMNIIATDDERIALFNRFDTDRSGAVTFKEFADALFGVSPAPLGHPEVRAIIKKFKEKMLQRAGENGVRGLTRSLDLMDKDHSGALSKEELFNGLQKYGIKEATLADVDIILKHFDRDGSGTISLTEFYRAIRGHMPQKRVDLVRLAYQILDTNGDQSITLAEVARAFNAKEHPAVKKGEKTADQVLREFMGGWNKGHGDTVTWDDWVDYYSDISAGIDRDDYFELMIRNAWHISGGEGAAANTSCRRVLVTHKDGHQTIEEIKNDLGIGPKDLDKMRQRLAEQGVRDIVKIELYG
jgi:Ca2+-binding EF-hand superfamily protein